MQGIDYFQDAQLLTLSWPYFPNMSLIVEGVAKRRGLHLQLHPLQHLQGAGDAVAQWERVNRGLTWGLFGVG